MHEKKISKIDYSEIPADFPKSAPLSLWPHQPKAVHISMYQGKCYPAGGSPPEIWQSWQICQELVEHFKKTCKEEKALRSNLLPEAEIIEFYFRNTLAAGWGTDAEVAWIFRAVAEQLGWPVPLAARKPIEE
jgi:hypothetical protein